MQAKSVLAVWNAGMPPDAVRVGPRAQGQTLSTLVRGINLSLSKPVIRWMSAAIFARMPARRPAKVG